MNLSTTEPTKLHYPNDPEYDYFVKLELVDLEKERARGMTNGHFIISSSA